MYGCLSEHTTHPLINGPCNRLQHVLITFYMYFARFLLVIVTRFSSYDSLQTDWASLQWGMPSSCGTFMGPKWNHSHCKYQYFLKATYVVYLYGQLIFVLHLGFLLVIVKPFRSTRPIVRKTRSSYSGMQLSCGTNMESQPLKVEY